MQIVKSQAHHAQVAIDMARSQVSGPHLSIYIPIKQSVRKPRIEFERLLAKARKLLSEELSPLEVDAFLSPVKRHFESGASKANGIAMFRSAESFYFTPLSIAPDPSFVVADSFHLKPLLQCISTRAVSLAVTVSAREIKLYRVEGHDVELLNSYSPRTVPSPESRRQPMGSEHRPKDAVGKFFREAVKQMAKEHDLNRFPVSLFGGKIIRRRFLAELRTKCSPEVYFESTIFSSLVEMAQKVRLAQTSKAHRDSQRFVKEVLYSSQPTMITDQLQEIAEAAVTGRIDKLIVDPAIQVWGLYDRERGLVSLHQRQSSSKDDCVIDDIIEEVLKRSGEVVFFDSKRLESVPPYLAVLRW